MNLWFSRVAYLAALVAFVAIRAPHGNRSAKVKIAKNLRGPLETTLLALAGLGSFLPLLWIATGVLSFADYSLHPVVFGLGLASTALGLWFIHRAHVDLGTNWSVTLQVREEHKLVTAGVYRTIRHPMYLGFLLYSLGQALMVPNGVAGPFYLVAFALLFALRVGPEERMMRAEFPADYEAYAARSKRLIPGVW